MGCGIENLRIRQNDEGGFAVSEADERRRTEELSPWPLAAHTPIKSR